MVYQAAAFIISNAETSEEKVIAENLKKMMNNKKNSIR